MSEFDAPAHVVRALVASALAEDIGPLGDLTAALVPAEARAAVDVVARAEGVLAGAACATEVFAQVDAEVHVQWLLDDGDVVAPGTKVGEVSGPLRSVLTGERSALNFLCHLSGVASLTRRFVEAAGPTARIWDTRKTLPGLRAVEKAAVRAGGGVNHRGSLSEFVLVKDNHLAGLGITEAVRRAHARWPGRTVEVECDRDEQVQEAITAGASMVLLDNMTPDAVSACVSLVRSTAPAGFLVEVSGGVTLDSVRAYADAGADLISTSVITQSAPALDLAFDLRPIFNPIAGGRSTDMLLAIDCGNTQTVIGLFSDHELVDHWRIATASDRTSDELALMFQQFLGFHGFSFDAQVSGVAIASGVPRVTAALREMTERYFGYEAMVVEPGVRTGMPILYDEPKNVGADRIANAVGAYDLFGGPTIVVDFGTANTVDAVSPKGEYLGGAIFPGIEISMDALFERAAALRSVELVAPKNVIGKSTIEAIQSGAVYGYSGQVDAIVRRFEGELGPSSVVATGGLAELIMPHSETIQHYEPWLTLQGLRIIYERNH